MTHRFVVRAFGLSGSTMEWRYESALRHDRNVAPPQVRQRLLVHADPTSMPQLAPDDVFIAMAQDIDRPAASRSCRLQRSATGFIVSSAFWRPRFGSGGNRAS